MAITDFLRSTFGVDLGVVNLRLVSDLVRPGEVLRGRLEVCLKEATDARGVQISLLGRQPVAGFRGGKNGLHTTAEVRDVFRLDKSIAGPMRIQEETFDIAFPIPSVLQLRHGDNNNVFAEIGRAVDQLMTPMRSAIQWKIDARVLMPWHKSDPKHVVPVQLRLGG